ncbi:hypothetical protein MuYL_4392 [Mucilaginibacter xinganensis]|uniref:Uncharacterized protein n=1 Tax=Mucilaginibacter xinganensis TaxID=1234841 RepID=A0A223P2D6_9SPHI|nr:hypothetical protein MuYL_4392 [Mucilaginibacter xinganensis]
MVILASLYSGRYDCAFAVLTVITIVKTYTLNLSHLIDNIVEGLW